MTYFKAKMHQIRFRLGLRPRPRWGSSQRSPDPLDDLRGPISKGRKGKDRGQKGREERKGEAERKGESLRHGFWGDVRAPVWGSRMGTSCNGTSGQIPGSYSTP